MSEVTITVTLQSEAVALALAQFVKRVGWQEMAINAVDEEETYLIRDGIDQVRYGLSEAGFSPR